MKPALIPDVIDLLSSFPPCDHAMSADKGLPGCLTWGRLLRGLGEPFIPAHPEVPGVPDGQRVPRRSGFLPKTAQPAQGARAPRPPKGEGREAFQAVQVMQGGLATVKLWYPFGILYFVKSVEKYCKTMKTAKK